MSLYVHGGCKREARPASRSDTCCAFRAADTFPPSFHGQITRRPRKQKSDACGRNIPLQGRVVCRTSMTVRPPRETWPCKIVLGRSEGVCSIRTLRAQPIYPVVQQLPRKKRLIDVRHSLIKGARSQYHMLCIGTSTLTGVGRFKTYECIDTDHLQMPRLQLRLC